MFFTHIISKYNNIFKSIFIFKIFWSVNIQNNTTWLDIQTWLKNEAEKRDVTWLGDSNTADKIIEILKRDL